MNLKYLLFLIGIVFNSLILYIIDLNTFNIYQLIFLLLVCINFLFAIVIVSDYLERINTLTNIFLFFWSLYVIFPLLYSTSGEIDIDVFTHLNNVALIAFLVSFLLFFRNRDKGLLNHKDTNFNMMLTNIKMSWFGLILITMSILMELINFIRAGGLRVFNLGKATFISQRQDLFLTLPSFDILFIGVIIFVFSSVTSTKKESLNKIKNILFFSLILLACIYFTLISFRTNILTVLILIIMARTYHLYIKNIKFSLVILAVILFFVLTIIGQNRNLLSQINFSNIAQTINQLDLTVVKIKDEDEPRGNEFTAASENFSRYYESPNSLKEAFYLSESYINGFMYVIPRYIYPGGEKPLQITTVYRDLYVPERAKWGTQSSTGFSTIIEGHLNGGIVGVVFYYFMIGLVFSFLEMKRRQSKNLVFHIFYLSVLPLLFTFSRRAFAIIFSGLFTNIIYIIFFLFLYMYFTQFKKTNKLANISTN